MKNELWTRMFGFEVGHEMKSLVLADVASTGADIREVIAKRTLPTMAILNDAGLFEYAGQMITPAEWEERNPLGSYGKIIVIRKRQNSETIK